MSSTRWMMTVLFAALTLSMIGAASAQPVFLEVTIPVYNGLNPASRPPVATYEWVTAAGSVDPVEVRYAFVSTLGFGNNFHLTENYLMSTPGAPEWSAWEPYAPPGTGTSVTTAPMDFGGYVFAVEGRDSAGSVESLDTTRNMRRVQISDRTHGPLLTVTGDLINPVASVSLDRPPVIINVNAGTPIQFCWNADASTYGGTVTGYRYGWDVLDHNDDDAWAIPWTPFASTQECSPEVTFHFGSHTFAVQARDYDGFISMILVVANIDPVTPVEKTTWGRVKALYRD